MINNNEVLKSRMNQIPKCGIPKHPITYTFSSKTKETEFLNPKSQNITLSGNLTHHYTAAPSDEIQQFGAMKKFAQPDSKRTLMPEFAPEGYYKPQHRPSSSNRNKFNGESLQENLLPIQGEIVPTQRKSAYKMLSETSEGVAKKLLGKNNFHEKYVVNSQINTLPGPSESKRKEVEYDIYTGKAGNYYNCSSGKKTCGSDHSADVSGFNECHERKVIQDYNSNVACLPGCKINGIEHKKSLVNNFKRKNDSQIVFGNDNYNNEYEFNNKRNINKSFNNINKRNTYNDFNFDNRTNYEYKQTGAKKINRCNVRCPSSGRICEDNFNNCNERRNKDTYNYFNNCNNNYKFIKNPGEYYVNKNKSQIVFG